MCIGLWRGFFISAHPIGDYGQHGRAVGEQEDFKNIV
jgi:hypothetical protein